MKKILFFTFILCFTACFSQQAAVNTVLLGIEIDNVALDILQKDVNDKDVRLSNFKGNYVLLDFWASWCAPCREEIPDFIKVYNNFHSRGFEILGVSLDRKKEAWIAAVLKDGIPWVNVSDLKGWTNSAAKIYQIISLPQNVLIDSSGRIVGKNLQADELQSKLAELYKKN